MGIFHSVAHFHEAAKNVIIAGTPSAPFICYMLVGPTATEAGKHT